MKTLTSSLSNSRVIVNKGHESQKTANHSKSPG